MPFEAYIVKKRMSEARSTLSSQSPPAGTINVDHLAHFVPDREACRSALIALGFAPTPFSFQYHRLHPGGPLTEAGTGNHCVMLREGYLEFLTPLADTSVANDLRLSITRYVGVHSIVFGTSGADADRARLQQEGFAPPPVIGLQRTIGMAEGEGIARFSVVRVPSGTMAEGRIQFCQHHSPDLVWQNRWLDHPNGVVALQGVFACVEDLDEASQRYTRFTGIRSEAGQGIRRFTTHRGWVELYDPSTLEKRLGVVAPALPWIAGCALGCMDLGLTRRALTANGLLVREPRPGQLLVGGPAGVGGLFLFANV